MKKVLVLGATGFVGKHLVERLLNRGYQVRVLVRKMPKEQQLLEQVEVIKGAYFDPLMLKEVVTGSDVVMTTIAPKPMREVSDTDFVQYRESFLELIQVLEQSSIHRFVHIAGASLRFRHEKYALSRRLFRLLLMMLANRILKLKEFELETLERSNLNWVSVRPPRIHKGLKGSLVAAAHHQPGGRVDVTQLADFMVDQIESDNWVRQAPLVAST